MNVVLSGADGEQREFEFVDLIEYESEKYSILLPVLKDGDPDTGEVFIFRYEKIEDENGEGTRDFFTCIEDEDTLEAVFEFFKDKYRNVFKFTDD